MPQRQYALGVVRRTEGGMNVRIFYALLAVFVYIMFMGWAYKVDTSALCDENTFWLSVAIVAAGAMVGGD
jgi:hypothetical protein